MSTPKQKKIRPKYQLGSIRVNKLGTYRRTFKKQLNMKKRSIAEANQYTRDLVTRKKMIERSVLTSSAVEGIYFKDIDDVKKHKLTENPPSSC